MALAIPCEQQSLVVKQVEQLATVDLIERDPNLQIAALG